MPRLHLTRTFLLLNLVCFAFVSYFTSAYYQNCTTYDFVQLKLTATLLLLIKIYQSTNLGEARLSKNRKSIIKALAKFNTKENSIH